jgi:serpin B
MVLILPDARDGLAALTKGLDGATWDRWIGKLQAERVQLSLPKFKVEMPEPMRLKKICNTMGIERMFDHTRADFTAMAPADEKIEISEGFHKAFIEVDEKGTEAAAATALVGRAGSAPPTEPPKSFVCDHPFAFAIRDTKTGAILFLGQVTDPSA